VPGVALIALLLANLPRPPPKTTARRPATGWWLAREPYGVLPAACAPGGADVSVRWTSAGRKVVDARAMAGGDKKIEACVERVMRTSIATFEATCRASFHIGR
jgi:hypothetical protein